MAIEKQIILVIGILSLLLFLSPQNVSAEDELLMDLSIICPSQVNESFSFIVTITSNNISLANVTVTFDGKTNRTDSFGIVGFSAPRVLPDEDNVYTIVAFKEGYNETSVDVTVANVPQVFLLSSSNIAEKTSFVITVYDDEGGLVDNVIITFNNKEYLSRSNGTVELATPSVNKSKVYVISATKQGYIDNSILITVYPLLSPENIMGFFIVIGICIIIFFAVVVIMFIRCLRRKRINRL